jgi:hypothetical protein
MSPTQGLTLQFPKNWNREFISGDQGIESRDHGIYLANQGILRNTTFKGEFRQRYSARRISVTTRVWLGHFEVWNTGGALALTPRETMALGAFAVRSVSLGAVCARSAL